MTENEHPDHAQLMTMLEEAKALMLPMFPDQQKVWDAQAQASRWRGLRDDAFRVLARLRGLHHDPGNGRCICRKPVSECPETRLLNDARSFLRWEADQAQRYWQSRDCSLPDGHPGLVNHKWPAPGSALP